METIVALATPAGNSGVAVIRISGVNAKKIAQKLIREELNFEPRKMYLKNVFIKNFTDKCLVVYFASPNSFTGEDVVEIHSHGGYFLAQCIIDDVIKNGCRLATAGEFSKRAFLNGKLTLDQAEGVMDMINAETDMQAKTSSNLMQGELKNKIVEYQNALTEILAEIEAKLDYPEYEYTWAETSNVLTKLNEICAELKNLLVDSKSGMIIKNGVKIAIVGAPNVGKSSLLNALTKTDKAIVTDIAGTTRDVIEAEYEYNGIIFRLYDTAGIHESADKVEKIGIDRALKTLEDCDLVLRLSTPNTANNIKTDKPFIDVINKVDTLTEKEKKKLLNVKPTEELNGSTQKFNNSGEKTGLSPLHTANVITSIGSQASGYQHIYISAKTNENIEQLKQLIFNSTVKNKIDTNKLYLTNTRHIESAKLALKSIENAISIFNHTTMDIISLELKSAWTTLGEISGTTTDEAIIDKIFSKFCLGK